MSAFQWMAAQPIPARYVPPVHAPRKNKPGAGRPFSLPQSTYDEIGRLLTQGVLSQHKIAAQVGVSRSHVSNLARRLAAGKDMPQVSNRDTDATS